MNTKATATLTNGDKVKGRLTTEHAASSYGQPVFVDSNNQAYNWVDIAEIVTTKGQSKGGSRSTPATRRAARESGKKGGRPRKDKAKDNDVKSRVKALNNGQTELFSGSEIGKPHQGIFVQKNDRGGLYTMSQCGDWLGDDNTQNEVIEFVTKQL